MKRETQCILNLKPLLTYIFFTKVDQLRAALKNAIKLFEEKGKTFDCIKQR